MRSCSDGGIFTCTKKANSLYHSKLAFRKYSRWESNPNQRFRKPPFYPLNYRSALCAAKLQKTFELSMHKG